MFLIVGLGNPGTKYEVTRHNIGFMLVDLLASEAGVSLSHERFDGLLGRANSWHGQDVLFFKPQTFMNLSGDAVRKVLSFFKIPEEHLIVIFDDLDQTSGAVRMRIGGGHGGHNGVRDILAKTGMEKFHRIKIGIGRPPFKGDVSHWVLGKLTPEEMKTLEENSFPLAREKVLSLLGSRCASPSL